MRRICFFSFEGIWFGYWLDIMWKLYIVWVSGYRSLYWSSWDISNIWKKSIRFYEFNNTFYECFIINITTKKKNYNYLFIYFRRIFSSKFDQIISIFKIRNTCLNFSYRNIQIINFQRDLSINDPRKNIPTLQFYRNSHNNI